jgi:hypothetical protein
VGIVPTNLSACTAHSDPDRMSVDVDFTEVNDGNAARFERNDKFTSPEPGRYAGGWRMPRP